jgi:FlaA1/EpsC-like NDP-sugar epimerase
MRRRLVSISLILTDLVIIALVPMLAVFIRFDGDFEPVYFNQMVKLLPAILVISMSAFFAMGLYNRLWRYASIREMVAIICAVSLSFILIGAYSKYIINVSISYSIFTLSWLLNIVLIGGSRLGIRILHYLLLQMQYQPNNLTNVLIIGAGDAGAMIAREIKQRYYESKKLIGFIDDDEYKHKQMLFGVKVLGSRHDITKIVTKSQINEIIIAMPSVNGEIIREIIRECKATECEVKILPGLYELIDGKVTVQQLRKVDLEDLLRRDPVNLNVEEIAGYLSGKRVLVTGAGGSIGSELCRQIAKMKPEKLILLGKGENSIYEIDRELKLKYPHLHIEPVIADVRDQERIHSVFSRLKPQVIFHAAAHKHVPLMEAQPEEAVRNNIFGTKTVAEAADRVHAEIFIMISTDKAVNPTSVMGATKRVAELIIQSMNKVSNTKYAAVRFGNVLGSRGSVVPLFRKQIAAGGPITITHPDMERYFMTIPEASQLVLQAGALAKGGEVFVLDMGEPVKIVDLAKDLIELSGLVPDKDIKIEFTGLRPGEKLFEELLTAEEGTTATQHSKIYMASLKKVDETQLQKVLSELKIASNHQVSSILDKLIPTYKRSTYESRLHNSYHEPNQSLTYQAVSNE